MDCRFVLGSGGGRKIFGLADSLLSIFGLAEWKEGKELADDFDWKREGKE
jgi:hypothetical protein